MVPAKPDTARSARWPGRLLVSCAVIFGPALLIGLIGPSALEPDSNGYGGDGEGLYLLGVVYLAMAAIAVGALLVAAFFTVVWLRGRARQRRPASN
jgi:hypothetical protein